MATRTSARALLGMLGTARTRSTLRTATEARAHGADMSVIHRAP